MFVDAVGRNSRRGDKGRVLGICYDRSSLAFSSGETVMMRQLHLLTIPTAISVAFFDATFLIIARAFGFSGREIVLGVIAGAAGGIYVLVAVLWRGSGKVRGKLPDQVAELSEAVG
jgi:hypothetical protein